MKLEFGNQEHINMVKKLEHLNEMISRGAVGTEQPEVCGNCGAPVEDHGKREKVGDKKYLFCLCCDSLIKEI